MAETVIATLRGSLRAAGFVLWTLAVGGAWLCVRMFLRKSDRAARAAGGAMTLHLWSRGLCRLLGLRVKVTGEACRGPALRVGNHRGYLDVIVLSSVSPALFVSKDDLATWPVLGYLGASVGTLFLDRTRPRAVAETGAAMSELFALQQSVIVFPEGTTTADDGTGAALAPFHSSLFEPALRGDVAVQAVALTFAGRTGNAGDSADAADLATWTGDATFLPHLWRLFCARGLEVRAIFREPVRGLTDRRAAADDAREWIRATLLNGMSERVGRKPAAHGIGHGAGFVRGIPHELRRLGDRHRATGFAQQGKVVGRIADRHGA